MLISLKAYIICSIFQKLFIFDLQNYLFQNFDGTLKTTIQLHVKFEQFLVIKTGFGDMIQQNDEVFVFHLLPFFAGLFPFLQLF